MNMYSSLRIAPSDPGKGRQSLHIYHNFLNMTQSVIFVRAISALVGQIMIRLTTPMFSRMTMPPYYLHPLRSLLQYNILSSRWSLYKADAMF